ncbi:protein KHNYN [Sinocyclocheilus rhinocerous]|uniref:Protein KHNYN-like n=1 Tax=Sinocyclocheilus rhinocerous TaxID=307959 RepID=A0A673I396_9TELE|nr:PREDICTED: protein KHNYN-like [Sinocyclocheilus rhinocerous]XP_016383715.1 PREDICTED: protein KHNYN-like [Sinocyclocheilus rhinocerous]
MALSGLTLNSCGSQQEVEDEFTCAGVLRGALVTLQPTVERIFGVKLSIGGEDALSAQSGQIWLQLLGTGREVQAAKLFVKGVVNQEAQQEIQFPEVLHCVFCGAKGLFMDCLIKNTSAHIVVGSQGIVLITGLAEPVVKAYSFITDLVEKYKSSQGRRTEAGLESLESRRAFKAIVESLEDRHTLDLLVLPVLVKEVLLDLVKQSGLDSYAKREREGLIPFEGNGSWAMQRTVDEIDVSEGHLRSNYNAENSPSQQPGLFPQSAHHRINGTDDFDSKSYNPFSQGLTLDPTHFESPERGSPQETESETPSQDAVLLSARSREDFDHLLMFFTAMGFAEDVVQAVLTRTGPKEASQLLDLIQQEQDKTGQRNRRSESQNVTGIGGEMHEALQILEASKGEPNAKEEDFVLDVLKKAAATCGYTEETVMEVCSNLPELKPHELLMQLQKQGEVNRTRGGSKKADWKIGPNSDADLNTGSGKAGAEIHASKPVNINGRPSSVRGPPQTTYSFETLDSEVQPMDSHVRSPPRTIRQNLDLSSPNISNKSIAHNPQHDRSGAASVVTGSQRFLESLKTPFKLQLSDEPGDPMLRQIIIDGSNVAMSHGLGVFFSCRGIALAVHQFWARGHREITVFVPQWRQKNNSKVKERQYMNELHDLGFLKYTPSREVEGKRINSYDDRFMLELAQKTKGVIVTNDNLRDLVDESPAWRDIIKKSLLQYVFADHLFMLPDDPLGRGGPHLRDFLHKHNSSLPVPGSHSYAGASASFPHSPAAAHAHTEVLRYRDWTPGGPSRGQGSGRGQGDEGEGRQEVRERSAEETLKLQQSLVQIFPAQESVIIMILQCHPRIRDVSRLTDLILEQQE